MATLPTRTIIGHAFAHHDHARGVTMRFGLLGPLEVRDDLGALVDVGGRQPKLMLAMLVAAAGRPVPVDSIIEAIWGDEPPASAIGMLQSYASRLRRCLQPVGLTWDDTGYRIDAAVDAFDHVRFEQLADEGRALLDANETERAAVVLRDAERLWRGAAFVEFADLDFASGIAARLDQRRLAATEDRITAELALGRHGALVGELTELVGANPLREGLQGRLALALYRSGQQAEALRVLAEAGRTLRDELGIEPGQELRDLETKVLTHDPSLDPTRTTVGAPGRGHDLPTAGDAPDIGLAPNPVRPIVGRVHELAELEAARSESAIAARFAVIEGEPGIGKTRLAEELVRAAIDDGVLATWGRSDEGGAAPALWPWLKPLRSLASVVADRPDLIDELLAGNALPTGQVSVVQFELFDAVTRLISLAAATGPVLIVIDDLQWADTTSLELLAFLAGQDLRDVMVVLTTREGEVGRQDVVTDTLATIARRPGSRRIVLRGLTPEATAELLDVVPDWTLDVGVAAAIHERSEGNPFFSIELARLVRDEGATLAEVPRSVSDVVRRRLAGLPDGTRELLGTAAVIGRDVDLDLLARSSSRTLDAVLDDIDPALVHRLLVSLADQPGTLRFSHALVREVLLEDLTSLRRARLHLRVADAMEAVGADVDQVEILAEHLWQAAPVGVGRRAAEALERAATVALGRVAYDRAEELLTRAVQLRRVTGGAAEDLGGELAVIIRVLEVSRARRYYRGPTEELVERAKELADRCGEQETLLDLIWFEWSGLATANKLPGAAELAELYHELATAHGSAEALANRHAVLGVQKWGEGEIVLACEHLDEAVRRFADRPVPTDSLRLEQRMLANTFSTFNHGLLADITLGEAYERYDVLLAVVDHDRFATASVCGFASALAVVGNDVDGIDRFVERAKTVDPDAQFGFWSGMSLMHRGVGHVVRGDVERGLDEFSAGEAVFTATGAHTALPSFQAAFSIALTEAGLIDIASAWADKARRTQDEGWERWSLSLVLAAEACVAHGRGDRDAATELFAEAMTTARRHGVVLFEARARDLSASLELPISG
jgi:DNA-binding SARP family transcriptional activator